MRIFIRYKDTFPFLGKFLNLDILDFLKFTLGGTSFFYAKRTSSLIDSKVVGKVTWNAQCSVDLKPLLCCKLPATGTFPLVFTPVLLVMFLG